MQIEKLDGINAQIVASLKSASGRHRCYKRNQTESETDRISQESLPRPPHRSQGHRSPQNTGCYPTIDNNMISDDRDETIDVSFYYYEKCL